MNPARWRELMAALGLGDQATMYGQLAAAYAEPHRHYHTAVHLAMCLREFDAMSALAADPAAVELALWFHDAIYDPRAADNEQRSAALATAFLSSAGLSAARSELVGAHILGTRHRARAADADTALVADIDLAIFGQDRLTYDGYERNIRLEYAHVPWPVYCQKRTAVLRSFLERPTIYTTPCLRERYQERAHGNLLRAIAALGTDVGK